MSNLPKSPKLGPPYPYPPITEAVVEFRYEGNLGDFDLAKLSQKLAGHYSNVSEQTAKGVKVDLSNEKVEFKDESKIYRRSNSDENEVVVFGAQNLVFSQLAIYRSWDEFLTRIRRDRKIWRHFFGYRKISQIGMRYINRIDVPIDENGLARHEDYLNLQIQLPPEFPHNIGYSLSVKLPLVKLKSVASVNSSSANSPIPKLASFTLDIDIVRVVDVPQRDDDIDDLLVGMRNERNRLFEAFIKDPARERFFHDHTLQ